MSVNTSANIAIIGAGVSGILTAIELQKQGYENITLYEKGERITSTTTTLDYKGHIFDISTKVIPSNYLTHDGIYPPLMDLFTTTGITLAPLDKPFFYDFDKKTHMALPMAFNRFSKLKMIRDFAKGYNLLLEISRYESLLDIYKTDLIRADESIVEWAIRHRVEAFGVAINYLIDQFNMGPSHSLPAGIFLISRVHAMAPFLHAVLSKPGIKHFYKLFGSKRHKDFQKFLDFKPQKSSFYFIREGYEEFFRRLVIKFNLPVNLNSQVTNLRQKKGKLHFNLNSQQEVNYDKVIFCCPPQAIAAMSYLPEIKTLLGNIMPSRLIRTWVFEGKNWDNKAFGKFGHIIDGTNRLGLASPDMKVNNEIMYVFKDLPDSDLMVSLVYLDLKSTEEERLEALRTSIKHFNLQLEKVITYKDFAWPYYPSIRQNKDGWVAAMDQLQGKDNLYYSGECFTGIGVPSILEQSTKFVKKYFVEA